MCCVIMFKIGFARDNFAMERDEEARRINRKRVCVCISQELKQMPSRKLINKEVFVSDFPQNGNATWYFCRSLGNAMISKCSENFVILQSVSFWNCIVIYRCMELCIVWEQFGGVRVYHITISWMQQSKIGENSRIYMFVAHIFRYTAQKVLWVSIISIAIKQLIYFNS